MFGLLRQSFRSTIGSLTADIRFSRFWLACILGFPYLQGLLFCDARQLFNKMFESSKSNILATRLSSPYVNGSYTSLGSIIHYEKKEYGW